MSAIALLSFRRCASLMQKRGDLSAYLSSLDEKMPSGLFHVLATDSNQWELMGLVQPVMEKHPRISGAFSMNDGIMYFPNKSSTQALSLATYGELHQKSPSVILDASLDDGLEKLRILDGIFNTPPNDETTLAQRYKRMVYFDPLAGRTQKHPKGTYYQTLATMVAKALKELPHPALQTA